MSCSSQRKTAPLGPNEGLHVAFSLSRPARGCPHLGLSTTLARLRMRAFQIWQLARRTLAHLMSWECPIFPRCRCHVDHKEYGIQTTRAQRKIQESKAPRFTRSAVRLVFTYRIFVRRNDDSARWRVRWYANFVMVTISTIVGRSSAQRLERVVTKLFT